MAGLLKGLFFPPGYISGGIFLGLAEMLRRWFAYSSLSIVLTLLAVTVTTSMAGRVWDEGYATVEDALRILRRSSEGDEEKNALAVSLLQILGLTVLSVLLVIPTGGLSICAAAFFLFYAVASAVIGRQPGFAAVRDSFSTAINRAGSTLLLLIIFCALLSVSAMIGLLCRGLWLLGPLVAAVLQQFVTSYITLVVVGEYIRSKKLSKQGPVP